MKMVFLWEQNDRFSGMMSPSVIDLTSEQAPFSSGGLRMWDWWFSFKNYNLNASFEIISGVQKGKRLSKLELLWRSCSFKKWMSRSFSLRKIFWWITFDSKDAWCVISLWKYQLFIVLHVLSWIKQELVCFSISSNLDT